MVFVRFLLSSALSCQGSPAEIHPNVVLDSCWTLDYILKSDQWLTMGWR